MDEDMVAFMRGLKAGNGVILNLDWNNLSTPGFSVDIEGYAFRVHSDSLISAYYWVALEFNSYLWAGFRLYLDLNGPVLEDDTLGSNDPSEFDPQDANYSPKTKDACALAFTVVRVLPVIYTHSGKQLREAPESEVLPIDHKDWGNKTPIIEHEGKYAVCQIVNDRIEVDLTQPAIVK